MKNGQHSKTTKTADGAACLQLGPLCCIRCAPKHPNRWMVVWQRKLPEWDPTTSGHWKTLPAKLTEADRREFGVERADEDEPDKVRLLEAFAPLTCFQCDHSNAPKARKEIVEIIRAIRQRESLSARPSDVERNLPTTCCHRAR